MISGRKPHCAVLLSLLVGLALGAVLYAGDEATPGTSSVSFQAGQTIAANSILLLARDGSGTIHALAHVAGTVQLVLDVTGYFQ